MSGQVETNVRLVPCAHQALDAVARRRKASRDETVRQLLAAYVASQQDRCPQDRHTHISTVLRYPPPPRWRREPRADRPLRVRAPAGLLERARALSLRLPGQHPRAHHHYQGRMLTDAVMTAIAMAEPFTDDFLDGLLPVLSHSAALGLWRLAVAKTSTLPEKAYLVAAEDVRADSWLSDEAHGPETQHLLRVTEALEQDEAWHSPERFTTVAAFARTMLTGPGAEEGARLLHAQNEEWAELYLDLLQADTGPSRSRPRDAVAGYDQTGRGGTAVWRAERRVYLEDFEDWLAGRADGGTDGQAAGMTGPQGPPGWLVRAPAHWHGHAPARTVTGQLPAPYATWVAEGRVLAFPHRGRQALWPLRRRTGGSGWEPVPGTEPLARAAAALRPDQITGFIEAMLIDWNHEFDDEPTLPIALDLPADQAFRLGFITAEERRQTMATAHARTLATMDAVIRELEDAGLEEDLILELHKAKRSAREFRALAKGCDKRIGAKFIAARASWRWPGRSVAGELHTGAPAALVQALATAAYKQSCLLLEQAMHEAWNRAFDRYGLRM